jgi:co-chaperonin GroES (HSP10)
MAIFDLKTRKVQAANDWVVVLKAVRPKKSAGGLFLPDEDVRVYCEGKVLSVGPKVTSCKPGDDIVWAVFKGQAAGHHDEERWALKDEDVIGVIDADAPLELPDSAEVEAPPKRAPAIINGPHGA